MLTYPSLVSEEEGRSPKPSFFLAALGVDLFSKLLRARRVFAGACCLPHGALRWQGLQCSARLHLTSDALVGVSWHM